MANEVQPNHLEARVGRSVGNIIGTLGFYSHVLKNQLLTSPHSPLVAMNPFGINMLQARERHKNLPIENLREMLKKQGVSEQRLALIEQTTGHDLSRIYSVGEAKSIPTAGLGGTIRQQKFSGSGDHGVYLEIDETDDRNSGKYYIGLKALNGGKNYSWQEIQSSLQ